MRIRYFSSTKIFQYYKKTMKSLKIALHVANLPIKNCPPISILAGCWHVLHSVRSITTISVLYSIDPITRAPVIIPPKTIHVLIFRVTIRPSTVVKRNPPVCISALLAEAGISHEKNYQQGAEKLHCALNAISVVSPT